MPTITTFTEARAVLAEYWPKNQPRHTHSLENMGRLMAYLGSPQDSIQVIHVAGTSGKTSTAYYTAALLHTAGKKVGLTVSPHVDEINERVQLDMLPLPEDIFCQEMTLFLELLEGCEVRPSYFEIMVAFAFWYFAKQDVDYIVIEVGVGGLLDSTNVVTREDKVCVITDIGLDHTKVLGDTLPEIATQKAGIILPHNQVFCHEQPAEVLRVFTDTAARKQAVLHVIPDAAIAGTEALPLFQQRNFSLAYQAAQSVLTREHILITEPIIVQASQVLVPARMEIRQVADKTLILDAAHNYQKLHALGESVRAKYSGQDVAVLASFLSGHLAEKTKAATELADHLIISSFERRSQDPYQSADPQIIATICDDRGYADYQIASDPQTALATLLQRKEPVVVVTGSFYFLNHIRPLLEATS